MAEKGSNEIKDQMMTYLKKLKDIRRFSDNELKRFYNSVIDYYDLKIKKKITTKEVSTKAVSTLI